jgi:hypothetical protein
MTLPDPAVLKQQMTASEIPDAPPLSPVYPFHLDVKGDRGVSWVGDFVYQVPTIGDEILIGRMKNQYLPQGGLADSHSALLVEAISYLEVTLKERPKWWEPLKMRDSSPLFAVYSEVRSYERRFRGHAETAAERTEPVAQQETGSAPVGSDRLGGEVESASKRSEVIVSHGD